MLNNILSFITSIYYDPLEQFELVSLTWSHAKCATQITNLHIILIMNNIIIHTIFSWLISEGKFNVWNFVTNNLYHFVKSILKGNTPLQRYQYFTNFFFLFCFIFIANIVGLIPYTFTLTSSFVITFFLALSHFIGINIIGIVYHKWEIQNLFLPSGVPIFIAPFLVLIEFISYIAKVFSLSIRLFANMMSGHALLKILIGFSWALLSTGSTLVLLSIFPWIVVTAIMFLELLIAFLQAYVFIILLSIYINDVLSLH